MRKRSMCLFVALVTGIFLKAQVHIQSTIPTVGLVQANQLWNLILVNGSTASIEGRIGLVLRDRQSGVELMTATTNHITLPKGASSVSAAALNPIQYNYLVMDPNRSLGTLLPVGAYLACYSFSSIVGEHSESLAEECIPFDIEPLSPPHLIFPNDSMELDMAPAQFSWTPPTPHAMFNRLQYELLITEVLEGQQAAEALQSNPSFYNTSGLTTNFQQYSPTLPAFKKEIWYAWNVIARDGANYAGKSEVYVFRVLNVQGINPIVEMTPFVKLKTQNPDKSIAPDGYLKLAYQNEINDSLVTIEIIDLSNQEQKQSREFSVSLKPGENYIQYNLRKLLGRHAEGTVYLAVLTNSRGEKWFMRFEIKYFDK